MSHVKDRCPECGAKPERLGGELHYKGGPDGLVAVSCRSCDWWKTYDPAADEFPSEDLRPGISASANREESE